MHIYEGLQGTHANIYSMLQFRPCYTLIEEKDQNDERQDFLDKNNLNPPASVTNKCLLMSVTPFTCFAAEQWQFCTIMVETIHVWKKKKKQSMETLKTEVCPWKQQTPS